MENMKEDERYRADDPSTTGSVWFLSHSLFSVLDKDNMYQQYFTFEAASQNRDLGDVLPFMTVTSLVSGDRGLEGGEGCC